jgi:hypothetical protein
MGSINMVLTDQLVLRAVVPGQDASIPNLDQRDSPPFCLQLRAGSFRLQFVLGISAFNTATSIPQLVVELNLALKPIIGPSCGRGASLVDMARSCWARGVLRRLQSEGYAPRFDGPLEDVLYLESARRGDLLAAETRDQYAGRDVPMLDSASEEIARYIDSFKGLMKLALGAS